MKNVFIIPICCREAIHYRQLMRCIESIRKYYQEDIILINDGYDIPDMLNINVFEIKTLNKGSADQQVFRVFLETDYDKMIYIQDSMIVLNHFDIDDIDIKFIWYFSNHRTDWDVIPHRPLGPTDKHIKTHTEFLQFILDNNYQENHKFYKYASSKLYSKNDWVGCFGSCCIITKDILKEMNKKVPFVDKFIESNVRIMRCANESIFALIAHYCCPSKDFTISVDGIYWDGNPKHINKFNGISLGIDGLKWCAKNKYIGKISFQRY